MKFCRVFLGLLAAFLFTTAPQAEGDCKRSLSNEAQVHFVSNESLRRFDNFLNNRLAYNGNGISDLPENELIYLLRASENEIPEAQLLQRLGFHWADGKFVGPTLRDLPYLIENEYQRQNTPKEDRLTPGWIIVGSNLQNGKRTRNIELQAYWDDLKIEYTSPIHSRVPGRWYANAFLQSIIPINSTHDLSHLVAFLIHPEIGSAMKKAFIYHAQSPPSQVRSARLYHLYEFFTLPDSNRIEEIKSLLSYEGFSKLPTDFQEVKEHFEKMNSQDFLAHAHRIASEFDSFWLNYGGGLANIPERGHMLQREFTETLVRDYHQDPGTYRKGLSPGEVLHLMGKNLEIILSFRGTTETQTAKEQFDDPELTEKKLDIFTRNWVAKMEYALWEGAKLDPESVISELVFDFAQINQPYVNYIRTVRGEHSRTYRSFLPATYQR